MTTLWRSFWLNLTGQSNRHGSPVGVETAKTPLEKTAPVFDIAPDDPIIAYFQESSMAVDIDKLELDSPALHAMKAAGVRLVVPLVSQGELVGLLNLGARRSEQEYSVDDRTLLNNLASQAAPAVRVAQLVRQQQDEAQERERIEQELRVAHLIQQTLLPKEMPDLPGWHFEAYYRPARAVGGDFYDFIPLPDGQIAFSIGDVTDKGVPGALVMATTRSILRLAAEQLVSPSQVLQRANELLYQDIPANMFVTCLYAVLDPVRGRLVYANAGHNLPYRCTKTGIEELRATGMPLGLMPGVTYEEKRTYLFPGEYILFSSDGLAEAHNPQREMFTTRRIQLLLADLPRDRPVVPLLLNELRQFTGAGWEQEDDVTLLTLSRDATEVYISPDAIERREVAAFEIASQPGNDRQAMEQVAEIVRGLGLPEEQIERLKTAVSEATMNAMEHGNRYDPEMPVVIQVMITSTVVIVRIIDHGGRQPIPPHTAPDLTAKLAGLQSPRGWGLFLIEKMVDDMHVITDEEHHIVELVMKRKGGEHGSHTA